MRTQGRAALAALLCISSGGAFAQDMGGIRGWYVGLDFGQSKLDQDAPVPGVTERDDTSTTYAVRVGYRFAKFFALEGGYTDVGDFDTTYVPLCAISPPSACPTGAARTSIDGFLVNAVGIWPVAEHFQVKGSLGAVYRELTARITDPNLGTSGWSDTNTSFTFGVGVAFPVTEHFEIDLDYTLYREIGLGLNLDNNVLVVDESESRVATLGLRWRF